MSFRMTSITVAISAAVMSMGAVGATIDASAENISYAATTEPISSLIAKDSHLATVTGDQITFDGAGKVINLSKGGKAVIGTAETTNVSISGESHLFFNYESSLEIRGKAIEFNSTGTTNWAEACRTEHGKTVIGGAETESFTVKSVGDGLVVLPQGQLNLTAKNVTIDAAANGIWGQNNTDSAIAPENRAHLTINAENTTITAGNIGIVAYSNSLVDIVGNLTVTAPHALDVRGNSTTNINVAGNSTVVLNGDIVFETPGPKENSGSIIGAEVNITLNNSDSSWTGNVLKEYPSSVASNPDNIRVTEMTLTLANRAQWNATEIETSTSGKNVVASQALNNLILNGGIVNVKQNTSQTVSIDKLKGTGGTINVAASTTDGESFEVAKLGIANIEGTPTLTVNATGINTDNVVDAEAALAAVNAAVVAEGAKKTNTIAEGDVKGELTQEVAADGTLGAVTEAANTKLDAYGSIAALAAMNWRHDMNDLTKRMGELRMSPGKIGSWARLYGSEQEYGAQGLTNKNTSVQVGADFAVTPEWKLGAAFTYTDGSSSYAKGEGDNEAYGIAAYGTWMPADSGPFVDGIVKYSRISNDFTLNGMDGSYDNNAFSASIESGWHFKLNNVAFVEPQIELTYGRIAGDNFKADNGVLVDQDDFDSIIGRAGLRAGFYFPNNKGTLYARASVLHDFDGEMNATATKNGVSSSIEEDLGGTWYEMGIGANFNVTDNTYVYVDLERNNSGKVVENWRWNVGLRTTF